MPQDRPQMVRLVRLLEGSPLAIELASAWVRLLSLEELVEEVSQNVHLLNVNEPQMPERHRSLRAVFEHSWSLLSGEEQRVLAALSVFRGGFERAAAQEVAGATLRTLLVLVNKSLLRKVSPGRFGILEVLRQLAYEKLEDKEAVLRHHGEYFLALAEEADPQLIGPEPMKWLQRLERDHDNLRAALTWALEDDPELGLRLAGTLWRFWYARGHFSEGRGWLKAILARAHDSAARAQALLGLGVLTYFQNDYEQASALLEGALALWRELKNQAKVAFTLTHLASVACSQKDYARAAMLYQESLALAGNKRDIARALSGLGELAIKENDYKRAVALCEESLALFRQLGDMGSMAATLNTLGQATEDQGNYKEAATLYQEGLTLYKQVGHKHGTAWALDNLASLARQQGDLERAAALLAEGLVLAWELRNKAGMAFSLGGLAGIYGAQGELEWAARLYGLAEEVFPVSSRDMSARQRADYEDAVACLRARMGETAFA
jgi:tetratricopeptide (TPR) repeat protein